MLLTISSVSQKLGIPASTLRYYEKIGLIKPLTRIANARRFDEDAILSLQFIQIAQSVGFTIKDIKQLLENFSQDLRQNNDTYLSFAQSKQKEIQEHIQHLKKMDALLQVMMDCQCVSLKTCIQQSKNKVN